ncbi:variant-silencing SET domain-containing protein-like [Melanaphis sacchari]|uniref:variant-silencing SET domain-containing protein-like n=1 Tax=Melanaphis sacchari TaxID=742174 RepID=UPI000DC15613|nr:variant-silencing SET domain-containing protein-like [Melanaphis sacchari]
MNLEMLIELVRERKCLYDMSEKNYSDHQLKENLWREIASTLKEPVENCKKSWTNLRDAFRRAAKKSVTKSGQKSKNIKKWKYEDEMSFLRPHMKERDSISNIESMVTDDDDSDDNEDQCEESDNLNSSSEDTHEVQSIQSPNSLTSTPQPFRKPVSKNSSVSKKKIKLSDNYPESASKTLMQYIIQQKENETKSKEDEKNLDVNDKFFSSMCSMVKQFSSYHQHVARSKIFSIVSELELQHINQQSCNRPQTTPNPQSVSHTPIHDQQDTYQYPIPSTSQYHFASSTPHLSHGQQYNYESETSSDNSYFNIVHTQGKQ